MVTTRYSYGLHILFECGRDELDRYRHYGRNLTLEAASKVVGKGILLVDSSDLYPIGEIESLKIYGGWANWRCRSYSGK